MDENKLVESPIAAAALAADLHTVLGFDLGHGDSAVAVVDADHNTPVDDVELDQKNKVVPTAVGGLGGATVVGFTATTRLGVTGLRTHFKSPDVADPLVSEPISAFVDALVALMAESSRTIELDKGALVVFGHPSGWTAQQRDAYAALLGAHTRDAGCLLLAESRAAFLTMREKKLIPQSEVRKEVLIVDLGSSTTDFTAVVDLRIYDCGNFDQVALGAGVIEEGLLDLALRRCPDRAALEAWFGQAPSDRAQTLMLFRKAKELFYSDETGYRGDNGTVDVLRKYYPAQGKIVLDAELSAADFDKVVSTPLRALGGMSWRDRLEHDLSRAAAEFETAPAFVFLTGGAARMSFVREIAEKVFATPTVIVSPPAPEFAISRGLALAGSLMYRTRGFLREVDELIESPSVEEVVTGRIRGYAAALADAYADSAVERFIIPEFLAWRRRDTGTLRGLTELVTNRMEEWQASPDGQEAIARALAEWHQTVDSDLRELTEPICRRYQLPLDALNLPRLHHSGGRISTGTDVEQVMLSMPSAVASGVLATASFVAGILLFGAGTAVLLPTGPFAPILAGAALWFAGEAAKEAMVEKVMDSELPGAARRVWSEDGLRGKLRENARETEASIRRSVIEGICGPTGEAANARARLVSTIVHGGSDGLGLEPALRARAQEAIALIA